MSTILVARMVFNLREAGTEVYEGTEEWRSRIEWSSELPIVTYGARNRRGVEDGFGADTFDLS